MKRIFIVAFLVLGGLVELGYGIDTGQGSPAPTATFIVKFEKGSNRGAIMSALKSAKGSVRYELKHVFDGAIVTLPLTSVERIRNRPDINAINLSAPVRLTSTAYNPPWHLDRIDQRVLPFDNQFTYNGDATGVIAYVIDTGVRPTHNDLGGRVVPGFNVIEDGFGTDDCNGHGTFVSGLLGGNYYGVAKGITIVPVRVLGCDGTGTWAGVVAGIDWIIGQHSGAPAVANMSLSGDPDQLADAAVNALIAEGVVVTVAAGNSYADACAYSPSRVPDALTVGAIDSTDYMASFSNSGPCVDVFAPGVGISSDYIRSDTDGVVMSGTSMSAPQVAGAVALALARDRKATVPHLVNDILSNATRGAVLNIAPNTNNLLLYAPPGGFKNQPSGGKQGTSGSSSTK